jgi:sigma-E factor negative regulatory protein RseA
MTDSVNEQLSACLDGELPAAELDLLLKRMSREEALGRTASRYSAIGAALREQQGPIASIDFAARVAQAVAQEEVAPAPQFGARTARFDRRRWLRPALSAAMAAGIATFAVLIVNRPDPGAPQPVAEVPAVPQYSAPVAAVPENWPSERLANYVVAHSEYSSPLGRPMVLNGLLVEQGTVEPGPAEPAVSEP